MRIRVYKFLGVVTWLGVYFGATVLAQPTLHDSPIKLKDLSDTVKSVTKKVTPATVALISDLGTTGSGVLVSSGGLILSAAHVVQGVDEMTVVFPDGKLGKAEVLGANYTRDAAMLKLVGEGPWPYVSLGDSDAMHVGNYVIALGHSKGYDPTRRAPVRFGRLVADGKQFFMMSECTLIGGDSGGPLFNLKGELVGIHSSIGPSVSINNHVPISIFKKDWQRLSQGDQWGELGTNPMTDPDSPVMGFSMLGTRPAVGVVVGMVMSYSPADKAGLQRGDLIVNMNEVKVTSPRELIRQLERFAPQQTVMLTVVRGKQKYQVPLTLEKRSKFLMQQED